MTPPRVLITGMAGTGTTFMAHLFQNAGFDLGDEFYNVNDRKGMEWPPLWDIKHDMEQKMLAFGRSVNSPVPYYHGMLKAPEFVGEFEARLAALDIPEVVKVPHIMYSAACLLPALRPKHIVYMVRPHQDWISSRMKVWQGLVDDDLKPRINAADIKDPFFWEKYRLKQHGDAASAIGLCVNEMEALDIPYSIISYPRAATDMGYCFRRIGHLLVQKNKPNIHGQAPKGKEWFEPIWEQSVNTAYIGYTAAI